MQKPSRTRRYIVTSLVVAATALGALALTAGSAAAQYSGGWGWGSPRYYNGTWRGGWYGPGWSAFGRGGYSYENGYAGYGSGFSDPYNYYGRGYGYGYGAYGTRPRCNYWNNSYSSPCDY